MSGPRVGVTAARKGAELAVAFGRRGADVLHGPTLGGDRPVDDARLAAGIDRLAALQPQWFAASTGAGMRLLGQAAERTGRRVAFRRMLKGATAVARGAKAAGELQRLGVTAAWVAPDELDEQVEAWLAARARTGEVVAAQVHGAGGHPYSRLTQAGAAAEIIAPYVSVGPADPQPGTRLAHAVADHALEVVTFTSAGAVHGLANLARTAGVGEEVRAALSAPVAVAVVGPVTGSAAERAGYTVRVTPSNHRSGALVRAVMNWWQARSTGPCSGQM